VPPRAVRRVLAPVEFAIVLALAGLLLVAVLLALVPGIFGRRRRPLRIALFLLLYCAMELSTLVRAGWLWARHVARPAGRHDERWRLGNQALLEEALERVLGAARKLLGFRIEVHPASVTEVLAADPPVLVLARHAGPGDSFSLVQLLLTRYGRRVRVVLKDILQLDPAIDVLLNRLGWCFINRRREHATEAMRRLVRDAGHRDAVLVFPEGANWTPERWRRSVRRLWVERKHQAAHVATVMDHVLPPRPAGVLACLDERPDLGVVMVAHAGLDRIVSIREGWRQLPFSRPMAVRIWPAVAPPPTEDERVTWLTTEWAIVDEWVGLHAETHGR
jgi:1-acyl-sn-glycerol-3-phosphate acyltransferase